MKYLEWNDWERTASVEKYADYTFPYINLGVELDVTGLLRYAKEHQFSFYCAMMHTAVRTALGIKNFSYRIIDGVPALCEKLDPMFVHIPRGSEQYVLIRGDYCDDLAAFCRTTAEKMRCAGEEAAKERLPISRADHAEILYVTCIPWVKYTHFIRTYEDPKTDMIPRLSWGKYEADERGRVKMPFSVQVHHALMDGYHAGIYLQRLQEALDEWEEEKGQEESAF